MISLQGMADVLLALPKFLVRLIDASNRVVEIQPSSFVTMRLYRPVYSGHCKSERAHLPCSCVAMTDGWKQLHPTGSAIQKKWARIRS
ncbi:hypothetical protein VTK73DRAFT_5457 [Phialemonium thermophilum]|uniref:Uncharacterized protein n=1 Tax=Phialemonium thermophilum TaxID=223376 RepID=A0ABR3V1N3_9PEZI